MQLPQKQHSKLIAFLETVVARHAFTHLGIILKLQLELLTLHGSEINFHHCDQGSLPLQAHAPC